MTLLQFFIGVGIVLVIVTAVVVLRRRKAPPKPANPIPLKPGNTVAIAHATTACPQPLSGPSDNTDYAVVPGDSGTIAHQAIHLDAGVTVEMQTDLTLVANDSITIDGKIMWFSPSVWDGSTPSANLTLICMDGVVFINGIVGREGIYNSASDGKTVSVTGSNVYALSEPGQPGGSIYILANTIVIGGSVHGGQGGRGGNATAIGVNTGMGKADGYATAIGAPGGWGGDVVLCAKEAITINGIVGGGIGGASGEVSADVNMEDDASAQGGRGGNGGNVYLRSLGAPIIIAAGGTISGGAGGPGGNEDAKVGVGGQYGGYALAVGGIGGNGGTVIFASVQAQGARAGSAGDGSSSLATAGGGGPGYDGGDASATGGDAGLAGAVPSQGVGAIGSLTYEGKGGDSQAKAGNGGDYNLRIGGSSGSATAQGGTGISGQRPPKVDLAPVANNGAKGGVGPDSKSPGTP